MRLLTALLSIFLLSTPVLADTEPTEIRLGKAPAPPPAVDSNKIRAVERFLAARQTASIDRSRGSDPRRFLDGSAKVDDETLTGAKGQRLVAFDFNDAAIEAAGAGRFRVRIYLLFADSDGRVVESRDETLLFSGEKSAYVCVSVKPTSVMHWESSEVEKSADALSAKDALAQVQDFLRSWASRQTGISAYSVEEIYPAGEAKLLVPCLRFTAEHGKRGYDVLDSPLVLSRSASGYHVESN